MNAYKHLEYLRREQNKESAAMATGYFDYKFKVVLPKTAAQLEGLIDEYCTRMQAECTKIYTGGRQIVTKHKVGNVLGHEQSITDNKFIPGTTRNGTSDLIIGHNGRILYCEVKFRKDRQSAVQKAWQKRVEGFGNTYIIVRSLDDFVDEFIKHFNI